MLYTDFKNKRLGKRVNYDGGYGYQCVDLFKQYIKECIGIDIHKSGNANQIRYNRYKIFNDKRTQIKGTHDLMMGDVIVSTKGRYGHIAVVDKITSEGIFVLEQNGAGRKSGNGLGANAIRVHLYPFTFWAGVWRCETIFYNLKAERIRIEERLSSYTKDSIRFIS